MQQLNLDMLDQAECLSEVEQHVSSKEDVITYSHALIKKTEKADRHVQSYHGQGGGLRKQITVQQPLLCGPSKVICSEYPARYIHQRYAPSPGPEAKRC